MDERPRDLLARSLRPSEGQDSIPPKPVGSPAIDAEREVLLRLRADGAIDDDVLRGPERELDLEERRMDA